MRGYVVGGEIWREHVLERKCPAVTGWPRLVHGDERKRVCYDWWTVLRRYVTVRQKLPSKLLWAGQRFSAVKRVGQYQYSVNRGCIGRYTHLYASDSGIESWCQRLCSIQQHSHIRTVFAIDTITITIIIDCFVLGVVNFVVVSRSSVD